MASDCFSMVGTPGRRSICQGLDFDAGRNPQRPPAKTVATIRRSAFSIGRTRAAKKVDVTNVEFGNSEMNNPLHCQPTPSERPHQTSRRGRRGREIYSSDPQACNPTKPDISTWRRPDGPICRRRKTPQTDWLSDLDGLNCRISTGQWNGKGSVVSRTTDGIACLHVAKCVLGRVGVRAYWL